MLVRAGDRDGGTAHALVPQASPGPQRYTTYAPGPVEGCPQAAARSGSAKPMGCHTVPSVYDRR